MQYTCNLFTTQHLYTLCYFVRTPRDQTDPGAREVVMMRFALRRVAIGIFSSLLLALAISMLPVSTTPAEAKLGPSVLIAYFGGSATTWTVRANRTPSPELGSGNSSCHQRRRHCRHHRRPLPHRPQPMCPSRQTGYKPEAAIVTALSLVIGGALAYRRLLHTRPFTPLARLELEGKLVNCTNKPALHVGITVKNAGSTQLLLDVAYEPTLCVVTTSPLAWTEAENGNGGKPREVRWDGGSNLRHQVACRTGMRSSDQGPQ